MMNYSVNDLTSQKAYYFAANILADLIINTTLFSTMLFSTFRKATYIDKCFNRYDQEFITDMIRKLLSSF